MTQTQNYLVIIMWSVFYICGLYNTSVTGFASESSEQDNSVDIYKPTFWLLNRDILKEKELGPFQSFYWNIDMISVNQRDTKILIHGWYTNRFSRFSTQLKDAYINETDVNVILVDWGELANQPYTEATTKLNTTAQYIKNFLEYLKKSQRFDLNRVQFVGFGLGAHLAGLASKNLKPKVLAITALDPISTLCKLSPKERLHSSDAQYVEVIHTGSRRFIGPTITMGHSDFFPNGGKLQPGCGIDPTASCSGERAVDLFIASIKTDYPVFLGERCNSVVEAVQGRCSSIVKGQMGGKNITRKYGIYSLKTTGYPPFH